MHRINTYGDIGSPWRTPLEDEKKDVLVPLSKMATSLDVMQVIIRLVIFFRKVEMYECVSNKGHSSLQKLSPGRV